MFREGVPGPEQNGDPPELEHEPQIDKVATNEQASDVPSREVKQPPDVSIILPDTHPIDLAIASYLREKGPQDLWAAYNNMSENVRQELKRVIADGDLEAVINAVEMNDPTNPEAQKRMHAANESDMDFVRALEKGSFTLLDRNRRLAHKHRTRALEWRRAGIEPNNL